MRGAEAVACCPAVAGMARPMGDKAMRMKSYPAFFRGNVWGNDFGVLFGGVAKVSGRVEIAIMEFVGDSRFLPGFGEPSWTSKAVATQTP